MATRILLLPGGTGIGSVAMAHAGLHKIVELHEERQADPNHPAPHTVVVLRDPALVPPSTLRGAALSPEEVFPDLADAIAADPTFFDGIDLIIETSGSTAGVPRRVGLSIESILASIDATHDALDGPGAWILTLPAHHIAGAMALLRSTRHEIPPRIVDTTAGFHPQSLLPAIRGTLSTGKPAYLSLVPAQLSVCLEDSEVTAALATLNAILVGGQRVPHELLVQAASQGLKVHTSYGMTETCGGVAYDGQTLPGTHIRIIDPDEAGQGRIAISGPTLMTRYLEGDSPLVDEEGQRWLLTSDLGRVGPDGTVEVLGRVDDVMISGGKNICPQAVEEVLLSASGVREACVVGLEDPHWGQAVAALIVPAPRADIATNAGDGGTTFGGEMFTTTPMYPNPDCRPTQPCDEATATALRDHVAASLGKHAAPRIVALSACLPTLPSGKVDRRRVAEYLTEAHELGLAWVR